MKRSEFLGTLLGLPLIVANAVKFNGKETGVSKIETFINDECTCCEEDCNICHP